jgi:hypothetical protein
MAGLYKIMIRCPVTKQEIDTGIVTSGREVLNSGIYQTGSVLCPHCNQTHGYGEYAYIVPYEARLEEELWRPNV